MHVFPQVFCFETEGCKLGCRYCTSGLGVYCNGPLGLDDLEVACDCECHKCPYCYSAYCEVMGGPDPCEPEADYDEEEDYP